MLWCELTAPPISCIHRDIDQMAELASQALFDEINHLSGAPLTHYADVELILRDSTRIIDNGPLGEHAVSPDSIRLSKEENSFCEPEITASPFPSTTPELPGLPCIRKASGMNWSSTESILFPPWTPILILPSRICSSKASNAAPGRRHRHPHRRCPDGSGISGIVQNDAAGLFKQCPAEFQPEQLRLLYLRQ